MGLAPKTTGEQFGQDWHVCQPDQLSFWATHPDKASRATHRLEPMSPSGTSVRLSERARDIE